MTKEQMLYNLRTLGLKTQFKPYMEPETDVIMLETKKPAQIVGGRLKGSGISLEGKALFRVWTPRVRLARRIAKQYGLRCGTLTGEATVHIPTSLADMLLPKFGAKVRRSVSLKQREVLAIARQKASISKSFAKKVCTSAV